jgi:hypothetical protein
MHSLVDDVVGHYLRALDELAQGVVEGPARATSTSLL